MKLPFDFGIRFVLRLVAPGALAAGVTLPLARSLAEVIYPGLPDLAIFATTGLLAGFALLLLDMPIYMLLEGRRYWPRWLRTLGVKLQARRLAELDRRAGAASGAEQIELDIVRSEYPIDVATGEPTARYPTRLGNLLASFETYPTVKYGMDGVFYWSRLWVAIDKDLREELDSAQAVVDGAIYCTFIFAVSALLCLVYWLWIPSSAVWHWPVGAVGCLLLSITCYHLALPRYAQYGELFKAAFDQHREKAITPDFLAELDTHMGAGSVARSTREKHRAGWRFLRWHRYRPPNAQSNVTVKNW